MQDLGSRFPGSTIGAHQLNFCKSAQEIQTSLKQLMSSYEQQIEGILHAEGKEATFHTAFGRLAAADGAAALLSAELTLPALVSGDAEVRQVAAEAKKQLQQMWSSTYSRADLYKALESTESLAQSAEQRRMVEATAGGPWAGRQVVLAKFRHVGAHLCEQERLELQALDEQCSKLCLWPGAALRLEFG